MDGKANVKLVPATIAESVGALVTAGVTQVGEEGKSPAKVIGKRVIRECEVTAVLLTVYVVVVVGTTNAPDGADPQAAGETELTEQFEIV